MVMLATPVPWADQLSQLGARMDADLANQSAQVDALRAQVSDLRRQLDEVTPPQINARVTQVTADAAVLEWDAVPGTVAYVTGRTGTDNRGSGVTSIIDKPESLSRALIWLKPDTAYTLFVQAIPSGVGQAVTIRTTAV